jgi:hypothetical protein
MNQHQLPVAASDVIETSRQSLVGVLEVGRGSVRRALNAYDNAFAAGTGTFAQIPVAGAAEVRDELVSLEGQLTLIASVLAQGGFEIAKDATNVVAGAAKRVADDFERMFDLRVLHSLERLGVPAAAMVQDIAERVTTLTKKLDALLLALPVVEAAPVAAPKAGATRKVAKKAKRGTAARH